ncbi:hypothetical protein GCM10009819_26300 [Agromyces tropicus]|uniref:Integral membrane protein n=1 Tax=Agromyces tropicus TaxID=555371 RepID=A0ABN2ULB1_9MICO
MPASLDADHDGAAARPIDPLAQPSSRSARAARVRTRVGQSLLVALLALSAVFALSTLVAGDDAFAPAATVLIASFGALAAVLGIAAVVGGLGSRVVRAALWALPLFFVWHVAALGTWVPDAAFAVVAAVGVALVGGPRPTGA